MYDSTGESIDLLQSVPHQTSSLSSSVPVTSAAQHLPTTVLPTCKVSRRAEPSQRRVSDGHGKQRARLVLPPAAVTADDVQSPSCSGCDDDDDGGGGGGAHVQRPTAAHCRCCCHCSAQIHAIHHADATDVEDSNGSRRRRSALDDDDSDPVSCIERDHLSTSGLYLPPLFVTSAAGRSGARTGDVVDNRVGCQRRSCLSRWWTQVLCRRRRDVACRCPDDDNDDYCWRLFPGRQCGRATSRDVDRRFAAALGTASLCSSPAAADDAVDVRGTSRRGDAVLLTPRCRRAGAASKRALGDGRRRCPRALCVILGGLCVAVVGLLVGGLFIASPAALHYSQSQSAHISHRVIDDVIIFTFVYVAHYCVVATSPSLNCLSCFPHSLSLLCEQ